jgi:hypothetical protein
MNSYKFSPSNNLVLFPNIRSSMQHGGSVSHVLDCENGTDREASRSGKGNITWPETPAACIMHGTLMCCCEVLNSILHVHSWNWINSEHRCLCTVLHCTALNCTVLYCTVLYCPVLYCNVLCCAVLYCTVLYCTVLYSTGLCCTVLLPPGGYPVAVNEYLISIERQIFALLSNITKKLLLKSSSVGYRPSRLMQW